LLELGVGTHLPQIVAYADSPHRIVELAQMLGGDAGDSTPLAGAREVLDRADASGAGVTQAG
jgi:DNA repair ATPase RecN